MRTTMKILDYLIEMGRTFRQNNEEFKGYKKNQKPKPKKNKYCKVVKDFSHDSYDIAEAYEDGFEKFNYGKRKNK